MGMELNSALTQNKSNHNYDFIYSRENLAVYWHIYPTALHLILTCLTSLFSMDKLHRVKQDLKLNDKEVKVLEKETVASSEYFIVRR